MSQAIDYVLQPQTHRDLRILLVDKDREEKLLRDLGLSDGEVKVYLQLLRRPQGEMLDKVVTTFAIPTSEAEDSLKSLADKGLVRIFRNKVEAVQPRIVAQTLLERRRKTIEAQLAQESSNALALEKMLEPVYWENRMGLRSEEIIEPLRDLADMELHTAQILGNAAKEAVIFAETFGWYDKVREALFQAHDRGVKLRILMMANDESTLRRARELQGIGVQVRHCTEEWYPVRGTLVDDQELVFLIWATREREVVRPIYYRPHYTKNAGLIRIFRDAFQKRWEEGAPVEA
ncbi:MAG: helix-turn-helix domain-containing protein [Candidatus Bathyarchaeia archaeon]